MRTARSYILFLFTLTICAAAQQPGLRLVLKAPNPVAVAGTPDSGYYVLSYEGVVYRYRQTNSNFQYASAFKLQAPGHPLDMTFAQVGQHESILVTQWVQGVSRGVISRFAPEGTKMKEWTVPHIPSGIVFDPGSGLAYFGTYDSNELYSLKLEGDEGGPRFVCSIVDAMNLGALALDPEQQTIYATDRQGAIFAVDLKSKKVTRLRASFGLPAAVLFDGPTNSLFVADQVQGKVYALNLSTQRAQAISEGSQVPDPSGLAPGPGNSLVVSDGKQNEVFLMQLTGQMGQMGAGQKAGKAARKRAAAAKQ